MATFAYRGVTVGGRSSSGLVEADSPKAARAELRARGILASDLRESTPSSAPSGFRVGGISARDLARMLRQLATMLAAGIPLVDAVTSLRNRQSRPRLQAALGAIRAELTEGSSFERAVAKHPGVFPPLYAGMIRAGEASGALDQVLTRIADHAESAARLQGKLRAALTYPLVMVTAGGAIVTFLLAYVVPQVTRVFVEANQQLPLPTRILMAAGRLIGDYGLLGFAAAAALALGLRYYSRSERGSRRVEALLFRLPWIGTVLRNISMARFAQTVSTMTSGGMPLVEAIEISRAVTGSTLVGDALSIAKEDLSQGGSLSASLERSGLFNPMVVDMIAVGEKSGELDEMLGKAAEALDEEVSTNIETMTGLLEPLMILIMAGAVLMVVLAVMLPVFEMNELVR